jgi:diguanylate cyclase (GGDEF)-like protein
MPDYKYTDWRMTDFFIEQMDFVYFFYGLAFILLGITCFRIAPRARHWHSWYWLGTFGLVHGASEWLDLAALVIGDSFAFSGLRYLVMAGSYVFLFEFARRELGTIGSWSPGAWIYVPIGGAIAYAGIAEGLSGANAVTRYTLGFFGSLGTAAVFAVPAHRFLGRAFPLAYALAAAFLLYGVSAGLIVPYAAFWPADSFNQSAFLHSVGAPVQIVRGLLACAAAVSIWGIWGYKLMSQVESARYSRFLHKQFAVTLAMMAAIVLSGWALTEYLGIIHKRHLEQVGRANLALIATSISGKTAPLDAVVRMLANAPETRAALADPSTDNLKELRNVLRHDVGAARAVAGFIFDPDGKIVASAEKRPTDSQIPRQAPVFAEPMTKGPAHEFLIEPEIAETDYFVSYPVKDSEGGVLGVAMLELALGNYIADLNGLETSFYLVDPAGVVSLSNRPHMQRRALWPSPRQGSGADATEAANAPIMHGPAEDSTWASVDGQQAFVLRQELLPSGWSLITVTPVEGIFASRVLGIAITLLITIIALTYIMTRERAEHDHIQMDRRLELEELARDLDKKASTDPLTGLANRLKFDELLSREIERSRRFHTPLALILFDIDHFKSVNDTYGHQVGDEVLIELSNFVAARVRSTDLVARWGGEEFALLAPHAEARTAARFARILGEAIAQIEFSAVGRVTCSFGVAELARDDNAATLMERVDGALYQAKMNGRNRVEVAPIPPGLGTGVGSAA